MESKKIESKKIESNRKEFTLRSMVWAIIIGTIMLAMLGYLQISLGMDVNTSPISIVMGIALIPIIGGKTNVYEVTQMQTAASAVSSLMYPFFTCYVAALWLGETMSFVMPIVVVLLAAIAGICYVALVRDQFISDPKIAFPQSAICVSALENIRNTDKKSIRMLYIATVIGFVIVFAQNVLGIIPLVVDITRFLPDGMTFGMYLMPMIMCLGYFLGPKAGAYMAIGAVLSNLVIAPIGTRLGWYISPSVNFEEMQMFNLPIFVGVALAATLVPMVMSWRKIMAGFRKTHDISSEAEKKTRQSKWYYVGVILPLVAITLILWYFYGTNPFILGVLMLICLLFSLINFKIASETGVSALMALTVALIYISYLMTKDAIVSIIVIMVYTSVACLAQNTMFDLRTGYCVGASIKKQVWSQFVGIIPGAVIGMVFFAMVIGVYGLDSDYATFPMAKMLLPFIDSASGGLGSTAGILLLASGGIGALLTAIGIPVTYIAFALYLAPDLIMGIALGSFIKWIVTKTVGKENDKKFDNVAVGLFLGDTLVNICITVMAFLQ